LVIKKNKNSIEIQIEKNAAKEISDFITKNKIHKVNAGIVFEKGKIKTKSSYMIPRKLLKLNDGNSRFRTAVNTLKEERMKDGESANFNMKNKKDVETIRNLLKGINPEDKIRANEFKKLSNEIEKASYEFGTNGVRDPCIVLADGVYINGNNRDTILEDLRQIHLRKRNGTPEKYDEIEVIVCDKSTTAMDIGRMELKEQVSADLRSQFDTMNSAMLTREIFLNELATRGPGKEEEVKNFIKNTMEGRDLKYVKELLNYADFIDQILIQLKIPGDHHKLNSEAEDAVSVTTIVKQFSSKYANASDTEKPTLVFECAALVQGVMMKSKLAKDDYKYTSRQLWANRTARNKSPAAKKIVENYDWLQHDMTSIESCKKFGDTLQKAEEKANDEEMLNNPTKLLILVNDKLITISDSLKGTQSKQIKKKLVDAKVDRHLITIEESIEDIKKELKKIKI